MILLEAKTKSKTMKRPTIDKNSTIEQIYTALSLIHTYIYINILSTYICILNTEWNVWSTLFIFIHCAEMQFEDFARRNCELRVCVFCCFVQFHILCKVKVGFVFLRTKGYRRVLTNYQN